MLLINNLEISKLIIDDHVDAHSDHIDDNVIKILIRYLEDEIQDPVGEKDGFKYFASKIKHEDKWYKLVWLLEDNVLYIGVITAHKDRRIK